jgi:hypothetical protein
VHEWREAERLRSGGRWPMKVVITAIASIALVVLAAGGVWYFMDK